MRLSIAIAATLAGCSFGLGQTPAVPRGSGEILNELTSFRTTGTVLLVAAHPDDEDTQLITYFAKGRGYRTGYLSINRGEGGQNLIGPELGDELGVIRTQELLAARRIDGAAQFFTRARDFGYSKSYADSLRRWGHEEVLSDVVRVMRVFQPDVVITRFSPKPSATHGHHTASAILALEAFKVVGDPAYTLPVASSGGPLAPWLPKRVLWDAFRPGFVAGRPSGTSGIDLEIGGFNPILGMSYGEIAALSRSSHRTQGFGSAGSRGNRRVSFQLMAGEPAKTDPFDGIDTTWNRFPGPGSEIARLAKEAIDRFDARDPSKSIPVLLEIRKKLGALRAERSDALLADRAAQLDRIVQACAGIYVETSVGSAEAVPGEHVNAHQSIMVRSDFPVQWAETGASLKPNIPANREFDLEVDRHLKPDQPYWLREEAAGGRFQVDDPGMIGRPENPPLGAADPAFRTSAGVKIGDQDIDLAADPIEVSADPVRGEIRRPLHIVAPVSLALSDDITLFNPGGTRTITVEATAGRSAISGVLRLESESASGWTVQPEQQNFQIAKAGQSVRMAFVVTAPQRIATSAATASAEVGGIRYSNRRIEIRYDHIPAQLLQPPARVHLISLDLNTRGHRVAYLPGAGDDIPAALTRMGYAVTAIGGADLSAEKLRGYDALVIGVRAFNVRTDLAAHIDGLFAYVSAGGTVVEQYNTPGRLQTSRLGPYELALNRDLPKWRVCEENAPVTILAPDHPALNAPNKIGPADFEGWRQERGLDFPSEWDPHYTELLSSHDTGEKPLASALLVARFGQGYFVVTGLSFFRELPAGVPGAYRLFANLVSLGK